MKNEIPSDCCLRILALDVSQPVLVARDRRTGIYIAHAVLFKRAGVEWIAEVSTRKGWQDAVRKVAVRAVQWISAGVWEGYGQGKRRCQEVGRSGCVRTQAVRHFQKSPTVEDLDRIIGLPHAPQGVQRHRGLDVFRPETVPEPEEHRSATVPDPSRLVPRAVYITRAMLERHGYSDDATPCDVARIMAQVVTRRRMQAALTQAEEYHFRVEQANFRKGQYLAEEVEQSTKRRREMSEGRGTCSWSR